MSSAALRVWMLAVVAVVLAVVLTQATVEARPSSQEGEGEMTDALKYLEELDKYYSQVARPRQRRVGQNMATALEKLAQIKNYYDEAGRPR